MTKPKPFSGRKERQSDVQPPPYQVRSATLTSKQAPGLKGHDAGCWAWMLCDLWCTGCAVYGRHGEDSGVHPLAPRTSLLVTRASLLGGSTWNVPMGRRSNLSVRLGGTGHQAMTCLNAQ